MTEAEVLVIGAGPAGIRSAIAAAENGRRTLVLDNNRRLGGQIWRSGVRSKDSQREPIKDRTLERFKDSGAKVLFGHGVFNTGVAETLQAIREDDAMSVVTLRYEHLILATGARERFLPFSGWTLPGVFGAGGLQALVKGGLSVAGKCVLVAGTGPLLLAVAAHLRAWGARVIGIAEQAPAARLALFAASLWAQSGKLLQGARYRASLLNVPYRTSCWPVAAFQSEDGKCLRAVRLTDGRRIWDEPCDLLACGFHLVPNTEIAALLGCAFRDEFVEVDAQQRTSLPHVFCAGEPTGIAGLEAALVQGEIAGLACAGRPTEHLQRRAGRERVFGQRLKKTFALRHELRSIATPETLVCRCEDVPMSSLVGLSGWTHAKLQTRCGMGPCQGRICGPAVEALLGWKPVSVRPPLFPVPLEALCCTDKSDNSRRDAWTGTE